MVLVCSKIVKFHKQIITRALSQQINRTQVQQGINILKRLGHHIMKKLGNHINKLPLHEFTIYNWCTIFKHRNINVMMVIFTDDIFILFILKFLSALNDLKYKKNTADTKTL